LDAGASGTIETVLADLPADRAGTRLHAIAGLAHFLDAGGPVGAVAAQALGRNCFPVRAILFDKTGKTNWSLGWHQDRTIVVRERVDTPGFGPWTVKSGLLHVAPPADVLAAMVTLRVHLGPVSSTNAPLLIARGSHRLGMVAERDVDRVVAESEIAVCIAERGDIWLYRTLILHASAAAQQPRRRRVLQVDYAAAPLPGGLAFLGI
jgi:ectoine hydroxylase-related dioxygenase (phytanoyl-CoA dioxygenase family)